AAPTEAAAAPTQTIEALNEVPSIAQAPSYLAIVRRYVLNPTIAPILGNLSAGKGGEIQLTDGLKKLNEEETVLAYNFTGKRDDIGDKLGFVQATIDFAWNRADLHEDIKQYMKQKLAAEAEK